MARRGAFRRRKEEKDSNHRASLKIRKGEQLFQCKQVRIKRQTGRRLPILTGDRGGSLARASVKTYGKSNRVGLRHG